ncbi:MAG TPA: YceI family protein [Bacteroidales bacterium]|nr:YceI family protein [Bacteroidales bacterium]HPS62101.1 YceI family protein [Bacteroidales bacterium]
MKTRTTFLLLLSLFVAGGAFAQKFITKTGYIRFYSEAPLEKIEANNHVVNSALDLSTGGFVFKVLMKSFEFQKALMQEHFNENYVESDKFPNATFAGTLTNFKEINVGKEGVYEANAEGKLTIHGVTRDIKVKGTFEARQGKLIGKAKFNLTVADFNITIPGNVINNIAKTVEVTVELTMDKAGM